MLLGQEIRRLRLQLGLSQRQLAGTDMTRAFISLVEAGRASPSEKTLGIIAHRLGKPLKYLQNVPSANHEDAEVAILEFARRMAQEGETDRAIRLVQHLLNECHDSDLVSECQVLLVTCLRSQEKYEEALSESEAVLTHFQERHDRHGLIRTYLELGAMAFALEKYPEARQAYENAARHSSHLKTEADHHLEALTYLGTTLIRLGELNEAVSVYRQAFRLCSIHGNPVRSANVAMGLGKALFRSGQVKDSMEWTMRAINLFEQAQSTERVYALHNLGVIQSQLGECEDAFRNYQECLATYSAMGNLEKQASVLEELGQLWLKRGDAEQAKACCREALGLLETREEGVLEGRLYRLLGLISWTQEDSEKAYYFLRMSHGLLRRLKAHREASESLEALQQIAPQ